MNLYGRNVRKAKRLSPAEVDARWPALDLTACPLLDRARLSAAAGQMRAKEGIRRRKFKHGA